MKIRCVEFLNEALPVSGFTGWHHGIDRDRATRQHQSDLGEFANALRSLTTPSAGHGMVVSGMLNNKLPFELGQAK